MGCKWATDPFQTMSGNIITVNFPPNILIVFPVALFILFYKNVKVKGWEPLH